MSESKQRSSLLDLLLRAIRQRNPALALEQSKRLIKLPPRPLSDDHSSWPAYWQAQGQSWRTEPEIDLERQAYLMEHYLTAFNLEKGTYPFKDIILCRADIEWLLKMHSDRYGLMHYEITSRAKGLDLRGANLRRADLSRLPLTQVRCGLSSVEWLRSTEEQREAAATHLEGANLYRADLTWASLRSTHLEGADLRYAHLEGAHLNGAHLESIGELLPPADLRHASFDRETRLDDIIIGRKKGRYIRCADVHWNDVSLATVKWQQVTMFDDEYEARRQKHGRKMEDQKTWFTDYEAAVRANRQLAVALQNQGLNEDAVAFIYRAQILQKTILRLQILQSHIIFKRRIRALGAWLFSWFLFIIAGYGYRLWRCFLVYILVIMGFATVYYLLGSSLKPPLSLINALALSMTTFHGRGFFPGATQLNDIVTILASIEAFVGLILEVTFIATLTQRFFGK